MNFNKNLHNEDFEYFQKLIKKRSFGKPIAYLTNKMVYVVPMLAAMGFIAASYGSENTQKRIDEDDADDGPDTEADEG